MHLNHPELPIQEDETAILLYSLGKYMDTSGDEDFVRAQYAHFIKPCADFMTKFIDEKTSLPHPSYDLWEERFATHSYTVFVSQAGLRAAARIARKFDVTEDAEKWEETATKMNEGLPLLFNDGGKYLRKSVLLKPDGNLEFDDTLDSSSAYGLLLFDDSSLDSEQLKLTYEAIEERLLNSSPSGGAPRYEHDNYFLTKKYLGNPWIITTLWVAQYYIKTGQTEKARGLMDWVCARAGTSGMLAEQVDPETGFGLSVDPLVWSHSTFIETALMLLKSEN
jgi:GH15 family glucan-1,4-alpha-glucosidase